MEMLSYLTLVDHFRPALAACIYSVEPVRDMGGNMNIDGKLYTLVYGDINALETMPIVRYSKHIS